LIVKTDALEAREKKLDELEKQLKNREAELVVGERDLREKTLRTQRELAARERDVSRREQIAPSIAAMLAAETTAAKTRAGN
jgi:hypothetical protein